MTYQDDDLDRLRAWLLEDTGSQSEAADLLPVVERLARFPGLTIDKAAQANLTRLLIRELQASRRESGQQRTIVCIDDELHVELISFILKSRGFDVLGDVGGQAGIELIAKTRPDLVMLNLPDNSGWDVYQQMKADVQLQAIPIIALLRHAMLMPEGAHRLRTAKVQAYITKPVAIQGLIDTVNTVLGLADDDSS